MTERPIALTGPEDIEAYFFIARLQALKLEEMGIRNSRGSVYAFVKRAYGYRGRRQRVIEQMQADWDAILASRGRLLP